MQEKILSSIDTCINSKVILYNVEPGFEHKYLSETLDLFNKNMQTISKFKNPIILSPILCVIKNYLFAEQNME